MKRTYLLPFCFSFIFLLMVSCNETPLNVEIKTKVTNDLNVWETDDGYIRTMQKDHYHMWAIGMGNSKYGNKIIFTGTNNVFTGDIYGNNSPVDVTISTTVENDLNEWICYIPDTEEIIFSAQTAEKNSWNKIKIYDASHSEILGISTITENDFNEWQITMLNDQMDVLTDPHYFGLYLVPVLIAVSLYY